MSFSAEGWAWDQDTGSGIAKCVLVFLGWSASRHNGECYPSMERIVEKTGHTKRAVRKAIGDLLSRGLITREDRRTQHNRITSPTYRLACSSVEMTPPPGGAFSPPLNAHPAGANSPPLDTSAGAFSHPLDAVAENAEKPQKTAIPDLRGCVSAPAQTHPEPKEEESKKEKGRSLRSLARAQTIPADWKPNDEDRRYALDRGIDPDRAGEEFVLHWLGEGRRGALKPNWSLAFRKRVVVLQDQGRFLRSGPQQRGQRREMSQHEQISRDMNGGEYRSFLFRHDDDEPVVGLLQ